MAGGSIIALMVGIHFSGNWGHFNILTGVVALAGLDTVSWSLPWIAADADAWQVRM